MKRRIILLVIAIIMMTGFTSTVFARTYDVKFINNSSVTWLGICFAFNDSDSYSQNVLSHPVEPGESTIIRIRDTEKHRFKTLYASKYPNGKYYDVVFLNCDYDQAETVTATDSNGHFHVEYEYRHQIGPWHGF